MSSRSSTTIASDDNRDDHDYLTNHTSVGQSSGECTTEDADESDQEDVWGEHVHPPEYYRAHAEKVNNTDVVPAYATSTILHLDSMGEQWRRYCLHIGERPEKFMQSLTVGDISSFFRWKLDQTRGKGGRKLRGTKDASSLDTYRKQFSIVYRRVTGRDMDSELTGQTRMILPELIKDYQLSHTPREKPAMDVYDVYDVREVSQTTITTTEKMYFPAAKRQRVSKVESQKPPRRSARLNVGSPKQRKPIEPRKDQSTTSQPRGQKRSHEAEHSSASIPAEPPSKRLRASIDTPATRSTNPETPFGNTETPLDPIGYWVRRSAWPKEYFESDSMDHILASKKSAPSLRRKRSEPGSLAASSTTPSDQKPRDEKSAPYRDARYETSLETKGSYMGRYVGENGEEGVTKGSKIVCQTLLECEQTIVDGSLFEDEFFQDICDMLRNRNEAKVIQDISRLLVPSAQCLAIRGSKYGAKHLRRLTESVNEGWNNSIPLTGTRPQPDYSVGFKREAFSEDQREKLTPFIGDFIAGDQSYFMTTYYMYFPFLTCEVKCGAAALDIADRQNAHSMTLAVRAVVELFRLVGREKEVDREILAFSVSHDHRSVRIYGHYAFIDGSSTTFYRHPIHDFSFTALDGKEKWTAYKFTKNVYDRWMPTHFARICSVIDSLPAGVDFDVPPLQQDSGLSQDLQSHHLSGSFAESVAPTEVDHSQLGLATTTPDTSFTQQSVPKRRRGKASK